MLSVTGSQHQSFAAVHALWSTGLESPKIAPFAIPNCLEGSLIALINVGVTIGRQGRRSVGKEERRVLRLEGKQFLRDLAVPVFLAESAMRVFWKLTILIHHKRCDLGICNTLRSAASFFGRPKLTQGTCKSFAQTVTESKRTSNLGPELFIAPPAKPEQERMDL